MRDDEHRSRTLAQLRSEKRQAGMVEVVGGFVEKQMVLVAAQ